MNVTSGLCEKEMVLGRGTEKNALPVLTAGVIAMMGFESLLYPPAV